MKFTTITAALCAAAIAVPAVAQETETTQQPSTGERILGTILNRVLGPAEQPQTEETTATVETAPIIAASTSTDIATVLANPRRDADRARDSQRNPAATLDFFRVDPTMTVAEYGPGGGWYTRVLAPYLAPQGKYVAFNNDSGARTYRSVEAEMRAKGWTDRMKTTVGEMVGVEAASVTAFEVDEMPDDIAGTVDRVLIFRSMHGLNMGNIADDVLKSARVMLKDGGMVGVVQHRAPDGATYDDYGARQRGYMRKQDVVAIFEANGFELAAESEVNANPADPANWERGVWTLPPVLATGEDDPRRSEYMAIGESDRMTLLFRKAY